MNPWRNLFFVFMICGNFVFAQETIRPQQAPDEGENYQSLIFSTPPVTNLRGFSENISFGSADFQAWNGSYWPFYRGSIAYRYNDSGWPKESKSLGVHYQYYINNPSQNLVDSGNIDALSPAEKYDLLIGNSDWTLTKRMWRRVNSASTYGELPTWFGICHGWSAATDMQTPGTDS
jgi:hypothetical protein